MEKLGSAVAAFGISPKLLKVMGPPYKGFPQFQQLDPFLYWLEGFSIANFGHELRINWAPSSMLNFEDCDLGAAAARLKRFFNLD